MAQELAQRSQRRLVEVADLGDVVAVRDSKNPGGPELVFTRDTWSAFVTRLKNDA